MTKNAQDFEVYQGDTKQVTITITDEAGAALTLTGSSQKWEAFDGATAAIQKADVDISLVSVDGTDDAIRFTIDPADTATLTAGTYAHEAEVTDSTSNVSTVTRGTMTVRDDLVVV